MIGVVGGARSMEIADVASRRAFSRRPTSGRIERKDKEMSIAREPIERRK
jgi:hypothetical protein